MPSPFVGMNPYLEHPATWANVHHRLITAIADFLSPQVLPKYQVMIEERVYRIQGKMQGQLEIGNSILVGVPDVAIAQRDTKSSDRATNKATAVISPPSQPLTVTLPMPELVRQSHLEIRDIVTSEVVTVIEVLSPANKRSGDGRTQYESKRQTILASLAHFVEIDLLRSWEPMPTLSGGILSQYRILVSDREQRPQASLYAFNLNEAIPVFPIPLRSPDAELWVDLQELLHGVYDRAGYAYAIDYHLDPIPSLSEADTAWLNDFLTSKGLR
jgi:hypothetical protein